MKSKLVRDKIPAIICSTWEEPLVHIASESEYWESLKAKLLEETNEVIEETNIPEELADLLEVMRAICVFKSLSMEEIEKIRQKKFTERWGFSDRIILDWKK